MESWNSFLKINFFILKKIIVKNLDEFKTTKENIYNSHYMSIQKKNIEFKEGIFTIFQQSSIHLTLL